MFYVSTKADDICKSLTEEFESDITRVEAIRGFSNSQKTMVYFVINGFQVVKMKEIVHDTDPKGYIIISEVADVFFANQDKD